MISSGLLRLGDDIPSERELAATLGVSRETVGGAIRILAARGIVEVSQGARTRVIRADGLPLEEDMPTLRELTCYSPRTVHEARLVVECAVVGDAARHISDKTLESLKDLLDTQTKLFRDPPAFQISDREFHERIYQSCANPLMAKLVGHLYTYALDVRRLVLSKSGAIKQSYEDHLLVYEALKSRDPDAAVSAMRSHLESVYRTTLDAMEA
jgi:DNA-binding FadR family transcriptional regulator